MFGKNIILKQEIKPDFAVQSIFHTIQGEGPYAGFPAIFIRLAGCNLKCSFCFGWRKTQGKQPFLTMANGPKKKLGDVLVGDKILTLDENGALVETEVIRKESVFVDKWVVVTIAGTTYYVTLEHPFFTNRGMVSAEDLKVGDEILHVNPNDIISWKKEGNKNPMTRKEVSALKSANTDYVKMGLKVAATIKQKKEAGLYTAAYNLLDEAEKSDFRKKISESRIGEKNPNWKGGPNHPNYHKAKEILASDHRECGRCEKIRKLEVHHIDGNHDNDDESNFEFLCHQCHSKEHKRGENFWNTNRSDGKVKMNAKNGLLVSKVKIIDRFNSPPSTRPEPLPITSISCYPHRTYLADNFWNHNCDTDFMSNIDVRMTPDEILYKLNDILFEYPNTRLVVITGGEPFRQDLTAIIPRIQEELECHVQIETAGTLWNDKFDLMDWEHVDIICSPKTKKVHPRIVEKCNNWKYIIETGETSLLNGLPVTNTQDPNGKKDVVFCGPFNPNFKSMIWVQPCDTPDTIIKEANIKHTLYVAMKYGYRFSYQVHKALDLP